MRQCDDIAERLLEPNTPASPIAPAADDEATRARKVAAAQLMQQRAESVRRERVARAAYFIAEKRGFAPGSEEEDWRRAEAEIDALDRAHA